jgi:hypothetical protein
MTRALKAGLNLMTLYPFLFDRNEYGVSRFLLKFSLIKKPTKLLIPLTPKNVLLILPLAKKKYLSIML